jgi:3-dehydroquinate synthase
MRRIPVRLGERSYDILIAPGLLSRAGTEVRRLLPEGRSAALVTDRNVARLHAPAVRRSLERAGFRVHVAVTPAGETAKSLATVSRLYRDFAAARLERGSPVVLLGGGVLGDLGGFAAATYLRGLPIVQVPTTLVAQVDSAIGGKVGVNLPQGKNLVGAFAQPRAVLIDPAALRTLPIREYVAGMAEVVKYGVIADRRLFELLERAFLRCLPIDDDTMEAIIARSASVKAEVVSKDERESGLRQILNYGHTIGHAIEAAAGYSRYLHGEAVAVGMEAAARLGAALGCCSDAFASRQRALLTRLGLPVSAPGVPPGRVLDAIQLDKKVRGGRARFVLPLGVGRVRYGVAVPAAAVRRAVIDVVPSS